MPRKKSVETTANTNTKAMRDASIPESPTIEVPLTRINVQEALSNGIVCCLAGIIGDDYRCYYAYKILTFYREHKRYKEFFEFARRLKTHKLKRDDYKLEYQTLVDSSTFKNKTIAVDFDGTLCTDKYPEIGLPNVSLIERLIKLKENNTLILWTCRTGDKLKNAVEWCKNHGLEFDYVNENSELTLAKYSHEDSRKITADIYVDDKSMKTL